MTWKRIDKVAILVLILYLTWVVYCYFQIPHTEPKFEEKPKLEEVSKISFKGFGWYGYLADDEINEQSIEKINELNGNFVNINIYYEYDLKNESFILLSNLTKIEEKIELTHKNGLKVFVSPFANLVGGHYTASAIQEPKNFLNGAENISIKLAEFAQKNGVEVYALWNELGLALSQLPNSTDLVNEWLRGTGHEARRVYKGILTTKEGVQVGLYENYDFSGFDCIGTTFYPFTDSYAQDPYSNITYAGVKNLEEYEGVVKKEFEKLALLKEKFDSKCIILGEIGIDVVGGKFVGNDDESKRVRANAYEIILENGKNRIDGFFFSKFKHEDGGSKELDNIFKGYFSDI